MVIAILAVIATLGFPAIQQMIHRTAIEGTARETATLLQAARLEAIKRNRQAVVLIDTAVRSIEIFVNEDAADEPPPERHEADPEIGYLRLPPGVSFSAPSSQMAIDGFASEGTQGWAVILPNGSVEAAGAFRFGDEHGNFLEMRVEPAATARTRLRKWDGEGWRVPGEGGKPWSWS